MTNLPNNRFHELLSSAKYTDLTLVCDGQEFKVHRAIVCPQSTVMAAAVDGPFIVGTSLPQRQSNVNRWQESQTGIIKIQDFDAETVRRMVDFLYVGDYEIVKGED